MLVERGGLKTVLGERADNDGRHLASTVCVIGVRLIKHDEEEAVFFERVRCLSAWQYLSSTNYPPQSSCSHERHRIRSA